MNLKVWLWGVNQERSALTYYYQDKKKEYCKIGSQKFELLNMKSIQEMQDRLCAMSRDESILLCTTHLEVYKELDTLLKKQNQVQIVGISALHQIKLLDVLKKVIEEHKIVEDQRPYHQITLIGYGTNEGEIIKEILRHFYLIQHEQHYELLIEANLLKIKQSVASIEDFMRDYIDETASFNLSISPSATVKDDAIFYRLTCEN